MMQIGDDLDTATREGIELAAEVARGRYATAVSDGEDFETVADEIARMTRDKFADELGAQLSTKVLYEAALHTLLLADQFSGNPRPETVFQ